jgi:plasmid stabilization system protein ParE
LKFRLFPAANRDLRELRAYIAADSPAIAAAVSARIAKAVLLIAEKPGIGRPTPQRPTREWGVPGLPYLIVYRVNGGTVEILRVWHTSRERPPEW